MPDPAKGQVGDALHHSVHKAATGLYTPRQGLATDWIGRPHTTSQSKFRIIGHGQCLFLIGNPDHQRDRAKKLLAPGGLRWGNPIQNGGRIKGTGAIQWHPTTYQFGTKGQAALNLLMQFITQIQPGHRCQCGLRLHRIARLQGLHRLRETPHKGIGNRLQQNKTLGSNTALSRVEKTREHRLLHGHVEIRIFQHNEGIGATQFQYALFQCRPGGSGDLPTCRF